MFGETNVPPLIVTRQLFAELIFTVVVPIVASSEPVGVTIGTPSPNINRVEFTENSKQFKCLFSDLYCYFNMNILSLFLFFHQSFCVHFTNGTTSNDLNCMILLPVLSWDTRLN